MIRTLQKADINSVADIWLDTNIKTHNFIPAQYWKDNFETVKTMLSQADVYVYENSNKIEGFIGLNENYIAGIFVRNEAQSTGIGKQLLDFIKSIKQQLHLSVYQKKYTGSKILSERKFPYSM